MSTRGIRNNNPGNIERNDNTHWQGMSEDQSTDERFCVFIKPKWGIRAIAKTLLTYQDYRQASDGTKIDSPIDIASRWAPSHENPTNHYANFIAVSLGIKVTDECINLHDYKTMKTVVCAIIQFENGQMPYDDDTIKTGLTLAGIDVPKDKITESRTLKAGTVATVATGASAALPLIQESIKSLQQFSSFETVKYALLGLTLVSIGIMVYARIDDHIKDKR
jgi:hypothetical protein